MSGPEGFAASGDDFDAPAGSQTARSVLEYLAQEIVDDTDSIRIESSVSRRGERLTLDVSTRDKGKIIGRRGRVVQAIRTVVKAAGGVEGKDVSVVVVD